MKLVSFTNTGFFRNFFSDKLIITLLFLFIWFITLFTGIWMQQPLIGAGIALALPLLILFVKYPRIWIYCSIAFTAVFFRASEEGVSILDVFTAILYELSIFIWIFWFLFIHRKSLITNIVDFFLFALFLFLPLNLLVAVANGTSALDWFREYSLFFIVLYYLPIRYYFTEKKDLVTLLILFMLVIFCIDIMHFIEFKSRLTEKVVYAFQLGSPVVATLVTFSVAAVIGLIFTLYQNKLLPFLLLFAFTVINITALIMTFSRTFWIVVIFEIGLLFFFLPKAQKIRLATTTVLSFTFFIVIVFMFYKDNTNFIIKMIENRLVSSTKGKKDISVLSRLAEYKYEYKMIKEYPFGGNGFGKGIVFFDPLRQTTQRTNTVHNGFIFLFYRLGIPISLVFLIPFFINLFRSFQYTIKLNDKFYKSLALSSFLILLLLLITNFTSNQFVNREPVVFCAIAFGLIDISATRLKKEQNFISENSSGSSNWNNVEKV